MAFVHRHLSDICKCSRTSDIAKKTADIKDFLSFEKELAVLIELTRKQRLRHWEVIEVQKAHVAAVANVLVKNGHNLIDFTFFL